MMDIMNLPMNMMIMIILIAASQAKFVIDPIKNAIRKVKYLAILPAR